MAKIRNDYENSWFPRLRRWVEGGSAPLDDAMIASYDDTAADSAAASTARAKSAEAARDAHLMKRTADEQADYERIHAWTSGSGSRLARRLYAALSILVCLGIITLLLITTSYLPAFGNPNNPVHNEVSRRYIEKGQEETGAVNIVAGMILDYRAFDTLGESNVLFVAACSVLILLRISMEKEGDAAHQLELEADDRMFEPKNDVILQFTSRLLVPLILLFGMYVIMNGHISPGGGFSGGAVMGAGLILYLTAFGFKKAERFFSFTTFRVVSVCALTFYAVSKTYSFFTGANHLHSFITPGVPGMLFSAGLIPYLNMAVGLVVCCTMYAFYTLFRKGDM